MPFIPLGRVGRPLKRGSKISARTLTSGVITGQEIVIAGGSGMIRSGDYDGGTTGWAFFGDGLAAIGSLGVGEFTVGGTKIIGMTAGRTGFSNLLSVGGDGTVQQQTIASGVITVEASYTQVLTQGGAGDDDLDTINTVDGVEQGDILFLRSNTSANDVHLTNNGNIVVGFGGTNIELTSSSNLVMLIYSAGKWRIVINSGGTVT